MARNLNKHNFLGMKNEWQENKNEQTTTFLLYKWKFFPKIVYLLKYVSITIYDRLFRFRIFLCLVTFDFSITSDFIITFNRGLHCTTFVWSLAPSLPLSSNDICANFAKTAFNDSFTFSIFFLKWRAILIIANI